MHYHKHYQKPNILLTTVMHLPLSNVVSDDRELQFNKSIISLGLMDLLLNTDIASGCEYSKYNNNTMTTDTCLSVWFVIKHKLFPITFNPMNRMTDKFVGLTLNFIFKNKLKKLIENTVELVP